MRITVLADNRTGSAGLKTEHGLCIHLDTGIIKVLLDTGASDVFISNASALGIDLSDVDYIFISHGHRDHAGGLEYILERNSKAKVIISSSALDGTFHSSRKAMHDITPKWPHEMLKDRLIRVDKDMEIEGMRIITDISRSHPVPKANQYLFHQNSDGRYIPDDFKHELALQIGGLLFTGCAHSSLMNTMESASSPIYTVVGGLHLPDAGENEEFEDKQELSAIAAALKSKYPDTVFYTGHCTGDQAFSSMKAIMGDNLMLFYCGMSLVFHHK